MSPSVGEDGGEAGSATWQAAQSARTCFSLSASLCLTIFPSLLFLCTSLCPLSAPVFALFYVPLSSFSAHSNCFSTLLFMPFCLPFLPLPPPSHFLPVFLLSAASPSHLLCLSTAVFAARQKLCFFRQL